MMLGRSHSHHGMITLMYMHLLILLLTAIVPVSTVLGFVYNAEQPSWRRPSQGVPLSAAVQSNQHDGSFINGDTSVTNSFSSSASSTVTLPRHVAFICDGNSRWATGRHLPTAVGHAAGADRLIQVLEALQQQKESIFYCTMYGFSTENWKRSPQEINDIFNVMERTARQFYHMALERNVCIKIIGDLDDERIPQSLKDTLRQLEQDTSRNVAQNQQQRQLHRDDHLAFTLCLAINYGGRQDILKASKLLAQQIANGSVDAESITENVFSSFLTTADIPDPDLIIRTSGECRLSNFFLWNAAYAELYFTDTLWPDFDVPCLNAALEWYAKRKRRFGARHFNAMRENADLLPSVVVTPKASSSDSLRL